MPGFAIRTDAVSGEVDVSLRALFAEGDFKELKKSVDEILSRNGQKYRFRFDLNAIDRLDGPLITLLVDVCGTINRHDGEVHLQCGTKVLRYFYDHGLLSFFDTFNQPRQASPLIEA